jgi:hypothetical protein
LCNKRRAHEKDGDPAFHWEWTIATAKPEVK